MSRFQTSKPRGLNLLESLVQGDLTPVISDETDSDPSAAMGQEASLSTSDQIYEDDFETMWEENVGRQGNEIEKGHLNGTVNEHAAARHEENNGDIENNNAKKSHYKRRTRSADKDDKQQTQSSENLAHTSKKRSPRGTRQRKRRSKSPDHTKRNRSLSSSRSRSSSPDDSWMSLESNQDHKSETRKSDNDHEKIQTRSDDSEKLTGKQGKDRRPLSAKQEKPVRKGRRPLSARSDEDQRTRKRPESGKRQKLLAREELRKFRSLEINPDIFLEEKLHIKYSELQELLSGNTGHQKSEMTRSHLRQLEVLREQYTAASHGVPPSSVLIPRSLPKHIRTKGQSSGSGDNAGVWENGDLSDLADDVAYRTMRSVSTGIHGRRKQRVRTDIQADGLNKPHTSTKQKKKKPKKTASESGNERNQTESDTADKPNDKTSSVTSTGSQPKKVYVSSDSQLKKTNNPEIRQWLHQKNVMIRKQKMAERAKQKEERQKVIMEANDKLERRIESQQRVSEWMTQKRLEMIEESKIEKQRRQKEEEQKRLTPHKVDIVLPDKDVQNVKSRPWSAPATRGGKQASQAGLNRPKSAVKEEDLCGEETPRHVRAALEAEKLELEEKNQTTTAERQKRGVPHPPASKFIYKRPVAGRIKFRMQKENKKEADAKKAEENVDGKMRMSYDDWLVTKRKADLDERKRKNMAKDRQLTQSNPELNKIVPDLARRRIDNIMANKKRVNTGIKRIDDEANKSFGGADFPSDGSTEAVEGNEQSFSYRLPESEESSSSGKVGSKQGTRPQTAPMNVRVTPAPKPSTESPRKVVPVRVDVVMANQDNSNPFKVPFPAEKGMPAHVAAKQRQLFSDQIWQKLESERPEPQGCDAAEEAPPCTSPVEAPPSSSPPPLMITANTAILNERKQCNIPNMGIARAQYETMNPNNDDDSDTDESIKENFAEDNAHLKQSETDLDENVGYADEHSGNLVSERATSRGTGIKRVSFCEQTQVFQPEEDDYSTDTATPDDSMWWGEVVEDVEGILERARRELMEHIGNDDDDNNDDDDDNNDDDYKDNLENTGDNDESKEEDTATTFVTKPHSD